MWRSVFIELSTYHKVHLLQQFGLSINTLPRDVVGKSQQHRRCLLEGKPELITRCENCKAGRQEGQEEHTEYMRNTILGT